MLGSLRSLARIDWTLAITTLLLLGVGFLIQASLANDNFGPFWRQVAAAIIGLVGGVWIAAHDYRAAHGWRRWFYLAGLVLLIGVLFLGEVIHGTRAWYRVASLTFQPVEFAKLILIVVLASYWIGRGHEIFKIRYLVGSFLLTVPYLILVILQPDIGSALVLFAIWFLLLFAIGPRTRHFLYLLLLLIITAGVAWLLLLTPEQHERIRTFLNPREDPLGAGWQVLQATIAVGAGGVSGRGWGLGTQSQLHFLPAARNDFIFAAFAEEFGFLGIVALLVLLVLFFARSLVIAQRARDDLGVFFVLGIVALFGVEYITNIAMNLGLAPVVGLGLPFMSAGGSALIAHLMAVGLLLSISSHQPTS